MSLFYIREKIMGEISSRMQNKLTMMADLISHPRNFSPQKVGTFGDLGQHIPNLWGLG